MKKISFDDIGAVTATFAAQEGVTAGQVVKITGSGEVGPCQEGDAFCGLALSCREGFAGVQVGGFLEMPVTGAVSLGRTALAADGSGGVKAASSGGVAALIVSVDSAAGTAVICL